MELGTRCREGTWSCDVIVAGCLGRFPQLVPDWARRPAKRHENRRSCRMEIFDPGWSRLHRSRPAQVLSENGLASERAPDVPAWAPHHAWFILFNTPGHAAERRSDGSNARITRGMNAGKRCSTALADHSTACSISPRAR